MRAALVALLVVVSSACGAGQSLQNDMRGIPAAIPTAAQKSSISDLESQIAGIQSQIANLEAQIAKIEDVVAAIEALVPDVVAALESDPNPPSFASGASWQKFLTDAVSVCRRGGCNKDTQTQLENLCATAACAPGIATPSPR